MVEALQDLESEIDIAVLGVSGQNHHDDKIGLGSQLEQAIRVSHQPIIIIKKPLVLETPRNLMLAYNGSPTSKKTIGIIKKGLFSTQ